MTCVLPLWFQVQWSPHNETILASSGTDRRLNVWDLRQARLLGAPSGSLTRNQDYIPVCLLTRLQSIKSIAVYPPGLFQSQAD